MALAFQAAQSLDLPVSSGSADLPAYLQQEARVVGALLSADQLVALSPGRYRYSVRPLQLFQLRKVGQLAVDLHLRLVAGFEAAVGADPDALADILVRGDPGTTIRLGQVGARVLQLLLGNVRRLELEQGIGRLFGREDEVRFNGNGHDRETPPGGLGPGPGNCFTQSRRTGRARPHPR